MVTFSVIVTRGSGEGKKLIATETLPGGSGGGISDVDGRRYFGIASQEEEEHEHEEEAQVGGAGGV